MAKEVFDAPSGVLIDGDRWRPIASILRIRRILNGNMDQQLNEQMAHSLIYNLIITLALNNSHLQSTPIEHQFEIKSTSIHHLHQVISSNGSDGSLFQPRSSRQKASRMI